MLENFTTFLKKKGKKEQVDKSKNAAKERLHLVLMQDRANVSADFLEMMKMEIVDVIKKYIDVDETDMDVKLENRVNDDGTSGAPALYANIPIMGINEEKKKESVELTKAKQAESEDEVKASKSENKSKATKKAVSEKKSITKTAKTTKTAKATKVTTKRTKKSKDITDDTNKEAEAADEQKAEAKAKKTTKKNTANTK